MADGNAGVHHFEYEQLPDGFYTHVPPFEFPQFSVFAINDGLARRAGLDVDELRSEAGLKQLGGGDAHAIAMAYSGHQFGHYSPLLGDGRARLVREITMADGVRELHLKGAGRTPFSRGGDGFATLGSAVREYLVSEAMAALDIPTSRALSIVKTGAQVARETMQDGAVLGRIARSHIRVGTMQYAAANLGREGVQALADFVIAREYPAIQGEGHARYCAMFTAIAERQADLVAKWMCAGFIHGVMNTDNMTLSGETIDYGPCAFMDTFHPAKVFSSIDRQGRYAWNRQPEMAQWNLARLAEAMFDLLGEDEPRAHSAASEALSKFAARFQSAFRGGMARKLGIDPGHAQFEAFLPSTFTAMANGGVDFTRFFTALTRHAAGAPVSIVETEFADAGIGQGWLEDWAQIAEISSNALADMRAANPVRIARNHRVEAAIGAANGGDDGPFRALLAATAQPCMDDDADSEFENAPAPDEEVHQTFCGT